MYEDFAERIEDQTYAPWQDGHGNRVQDVYKDAEFEKSQEWIFTFGYNHIWPVNGKTLGKCYVVLKGTYEGTRDEMNHRFNHQWSHQYDSRRAAGVDRHELSEIRLEHEKAEYR